MLGHFVDGFGLASLDERVEAIRNIAEPTSLAAQEHFLGVMGYLRDKDPRYLQIAEPLQKLKTSLLKVAPVAEQQRKSYVNRTKSSI